LWFWRTAFKMEADVILEGSNRQFLSEKQDSPPASASELELTRL